jgi:metal-dependent amidase/aminoacylase/carboxypeptidase family protein
MDRFGIDEVYGMHNYPGMPVGEFAIRPGPIMASPTSSISTSKGVGGHAARPHLGIDTVLVGAQIVNSCSRSCRAMSIRWNRPWSRSACSRPAMPAMSSRNTRLRGTARSLTPRCAIFWSGACRSCRGNGGGFTAPRPSSAISAGYPVLVNHDRETDFAAAVAREIVGAARSMLQMPPMMGAEDFSYMLEARPGAFIWVGNGDSAGLHHPSYNFNDEAIPFGTSYWVRLWRCARTADAR